MLRSVDSVSEEDGMHHAYPAEFLQQLNAGGLPPALLCLKVSSPVICHDLAKQLSHYLYFFSFSFSFLLSWTYYTEGSAGKCHVT